MTDHNDIPLETFSAQFERHTERLSTVEIEQLQAVLGIFRQRLSEPQYRERHPGFSLSVVLRELISEPSERLAEAVTMLERWISPGSTR